MKQLLEVGAHFGHQTKRWNPKMKKFIFMERNGIHIFDLRHTIDAIEKASRMIADFVRQGEIMIFVGTKKQAQEIVKEEAERCGMYYVNERWVGGLLTNFPEIRKRIDRLEEMIRMEERGDTSKFTYKELKEFKKEKEKLMKFFGGLRGIQKIPKVVFVADTKKDI
ncbi:MAG TPA: 30S ribosomal protein S2, partial [bacterium]|nr:30S ribosomal protein S2 [bacterium]